MLPALKQVNVPTLGNKQYKNKSASHLPFFSLSKTLCSVMLGFIHEGPLIIHQCHSSRDGYSGRDELVFSIRVDSLRGQKQVGGLRAVLLSPRLRFPRARAGGSFR